MRLLILCAMLGAAVTSPACDFCGCGSAGVDVGLISGTQGNHVGINFTTKRYLHFDSETAGKTWLASWTVRGSYAPVEQFQVKVFLPVYLQLNRSEDVRRAGTGDMILLGEYRVVSATNQERPVRNNLYLSAGLEMPTGKYNPDAELNTSIIPFGSKSWDLLAGLNYILGAGDVSVSAGGIFKYNTYNKYDQRYGMSLEGVIQVGYNFLAGNSGIQPFVGWRANWQDQSVKNGFYRSLTGGAVLSQLAGLQYSYQQITLAAYGDVPILQRLNNPDIKNGASWSIQFTYNL